MDGLRLIVEAVQQRLAEASQAKAQGRTDWWKANTKQCTASLHVFAVFFFSCFLFLITVSVFYLICRRQIATVLLFPCLTFILVWQLREAAILAIGTVANYLHEAKVLQYCFWWLRPCSVPSWFFFSICLYLTLLAVCCCTGAFRKIYWHSILSPSWIPFWTRILGQVCLWASVCCSMKCLFLLCPVYFNLWISNVTRSFLFFFLPNGSVLLLQ